MEPGGRTSKGNGDLMALNHMFVSMIRWRIMSQPAYNVRFYARYRFLKCLERI
jgi:hypothetical protein